MTGFVWWYKLLEFSGLNIIFHLSWFYELVHLTDTGIRFFFWISSALEGMGELNTEPSEANFTDILYLTDNPKLSKNDYNKRIIDGVY